MNHQPLFKWLGLPPGPWPPDDRTLLGLPPGPVDPFVAETRALERMDRLRPHQLVHPDLVTEGMNRLAQALVALSSSAASAATLPSAPPAPRRSIPTPAPARPIAPRPAPPPPAAPVFEAVDFALPTPGVPAAAELPPPPEIAEAEVVEAEVVPLAPVPPPRRTVRPARAKPAAEPAAELAPPAPAGLVVPAVGRRQAYRELAGLRQLRRAWRRLRASVADPAEPLAGPTEVCGYLEAVLDVRAALARPGLEEHALGASGDTVRSVARNPHALAVFRALVPTQRQALARDWALGLAAIETRYGAVRAFQHDNVPAGRRTLQGVRRIARTLVHSPEWLLGGLTATTLVVVAFRVAIR